MLQEIICIIFHRRHHAWLGGFRICAKCDRINPPGVRVLAVA